MLKQAARMLLRNLGYEVYRRVDPVVLDRGAAATPAVEPVWPLPCVDDLAMQHLRQSFHRFPEWHYGFEFSDGFSLFDAGADRVRVQPPERALQRFRHFMPHVVKAAGGSLRGKRVLDIACNAGYWSLQCAMLGAKVVGFDARPDLIEQANLVKAVVGAPDVEYRVLDYWDMRPEILGGTFDVVLNLGILYHLHDSVEALRRTVAMSHHLVVLDTTTAPLRDTVVKLSWEEADNIEDAAATGIVAIPSQSAVEMMFRHLRVKRYREIPLWQFPMPPDYRCGSRASWLVEV